MFEQTEKGNVLIIDDDQNYSLELGDVIRSIGFDALSVSTLSDGLRMVRNEQFDLVFLDHNLPDGRGIGALSQLLNTPSAPEIIIIADIGDPDEAEKVIRGGAWDYVERPTSAVSMRLPIIRALQYRQNKIKRDCNSEDRNNQLFFEGVIGKSPIMQECIELLVQAADSEANVVLTGETGTGKEVFAYAIHKNSPRANKNFVVVDCTCLPETLVESTLFGHKKGSFTGAVSDQEGLVKQAHGGTLFLDEVGELPLTVQTSFLRVLEEQRFRAVGGSREENSDFRLIAATNQDLDAMVRSREFRQDLLFRLRSFNIDLPPLRERIEDISELAQYHMNQICENYRITPKEFTTDFIEVLKGYSWPGNVRELVNSLERAIVSAKREPVLFPKHLPTNIRIQTVRKHIDNVREIDEKSNTSSSSQASLPLLQDVRDAAVANAEQHYLKELMAATEGDISHACCMSGLSRSRLYALLKKHAVGRPA